MTGMQMSSNTRSNCALGSSKYLGEVQAMYDRVHYIIPSARRDAEARD